MSVRTFSAFFLFARYDGIVYVTEKNRIKAIAIPAPLPYSSSFLSIFVATSHLKRSPPAIYSAAFLLCQRKPEVRLLDRVPIIGHVDHFRTQPVHVSPVLLPVGLPRPGGRNTKRSSSKRRTVGSVRAFFAGVISRHPEDFTGVFSDRRISSRIRAESLAAQDRLTPTNINSPCEISIPTRDRLVLRKRQGACDGVVRRRRDPRGRDPRVRRCAPEYQSSQQKKHLCRCCRCAGPRCSVCACRGCRCCRCRGYCRRSC